MIEMNEVLRRIGDSEGFCATPKRCPAGYLSIGYGRNIEQNPLSKEEQQHLHCGPQGPNPISEKDAEYLLQNDVNKCMKQLDKKYPWWRNLDDERQFVVLDMCFNMGLGGFSKFKKMHTALQEGDYEEAANCMKNSAYYKQVGQRSARNYQILKTGVSPSEKGTKGRSVSSSSKPIKTNEGENEELKDSLKSDKSKYDLEKIVATIIELFKKIHNIPEPDKTTGEKFANNAQILAKAYGKNAVGTLQDATNNYASNGCSSAIESADNLVKNSKLLLEGKEQPKAAEKTLYINPTYLSNQGR